jgi:hypothetical protein
VNARLMRVKVLHDHGWGTTATMIAGLRYALDEGARIVNRAQRFASAGRSTMRSEQAESYARGHVPGNDGRKLTACPLRRQAPPPVRLLPPTVAGAPRPARRLALDHRPRGARRQIPAE